MRSDDADFQDANGEIEMIRWDRVGKEMMLWDRVGWDRIGHDRKGCNPHFTSQLSGLCGVCGVKVVK